MDNRSTQTRIRRGDAFQRTVATFLLFTAFAPTSAGCSFLFVKGAPPVAERHGVLDCSSSVAAPTIDYLVTGFQIYRTANAASRRDADYRGAPLTRSADIGFGVGLMALFLSSAIYGTVAIGSCKEAMRSASTRARSPYGPPAAPIAPPTALPLPAAAAAGAPQPAQQQDSDAP